MAPLRSRVDARGQVIVPKPIRDKLQIRPGEPLLFHVQEDKIVITRETKDTEHLKALTRLLPKRPAPDHPDWDEEYGSQLH